MGITEDLTLLHNVTTMETSKSQIGNLCVEAIWCGYHLLESHPAKTVKLSSPRVFLLRCRNQRTTPHVVQFQHPIQVDVTRRICHSLLHEHIHFIHSKLDEISWELLETHMQLLQNWLMQTGSWLAVSRATRLSTFLQKIRADSVTNSLSCITQQYDDHDQLKEFSGGQCHTFCHVKVSELCGVSSDAASGVHHDWMKRGRLTKLRYCQTGNLES
jgi:hypothetical protein